MLGLTSAVANAGSLVGECFLVMFVKFLVKLEKLRYGLPVSHDRLCLFASKMIWDEIRW